MPTGRNRPCPCGSGRKYKLCCMPETPCPLEDIALGLHHRVHELERKIVKLAPGLIGHAADARAVEAFCRDDPTVELDGPESQAFVPWLLYEWREVGASGPTRGGRGAAAQGPASTPAAETYLERHGDRLGDFERRYLHDACRLPFSFYDVLRTSADHRVALYDILREREAEIIDREGARLLEPGDILFAKVMRVEGIPLMTGNGSVRIPPRDKAPILAVRRRLRAGHGEITDKVLRAEWAILWDLYFEIRDRLLHPPLPELRNTDGDPLELHTIRYRVESAATAFEALRDLAKGWSRAELLEDARRGRDGRLRSVEIPWSKRGNRVHLGRDHTVLGHIRIDRDRMTVEVNSAKRARRIRALIERRLGARAEHRSTEFRSFEEELARIEPGDRAAEAVRRRREQEELASNPEVEEMLRQPLASHWDTWPETPLPALGGLTPAEAVLDPDGREMVEALVTQFERDEREAGPNAGAGLDAGKLRRRLGLAPRSNP